MIPKNLKLPLTLLLTLAFLIALVPTAQAASILPACVAEGYCTLCDILQTGINFGQFLLGIVGSLALLMFVYGGLTWLTSGGEPDKITAGKKILINSAVGLAITFFAYVIVIFVVSTLAPGWTWQDKMNLSCAPLAGLEKPTNTETGDNAAIGKKCTSSRECPESLYCKAPVENASEGTCQPDVALGASCADIWDIGGFNSNVCITTVCFGMTQKCTWPLNSKKGALGDYCTATGQCSTGSCKCPGDDTTLNRDSTGYNKCEEGTCQPQIPKGDTSRYCDDYEAGGGFLAPDDARCESGDCLETSTEKCAP
jgi:hypothetical protein